LTTPEGSLKDKCHKWVKKQQELGVSIEALKLAGGPRQRVGENDYFLCYRRITVIIELKQPGEDYTPLQRHRAEKWAKAGAVIGCAHTLDEFVEIVRQVDVHGLSEFGVSMDLKG
jgi:hypothetical protein